MSGTLSQQSRVLIPVPTLNISESFGKCASRIDGKNNFEVNAFIDAVETYKKCINIPDDFVVKVTVDNWNDALDLLKHAYGNGPNKPSYHIYRELFSLEQDDKTSTDIFVCQYRPLIAQLPRSTHIENMQIDMVNGLLSLQIRRIARNVEENFFENDIVLKNTKGSITKNRPKCKDCKVFGHVVEDCRRLENNKNDKICPNTTVHFMMNILFLQRDCPKCKLKSESKRKLLEKSKVCSLDTDIFCSPRQRSILHVEICGAKEKLCAYVPYGAKHHIHKHQIAHIHEISHGHHHHGSHYKPHEHEVISPHIEGPPSLHSNEHKDHYDAYDGSDNSYPTGLYFGNE
ncbi:hypothetical protein NQ314_007625 [Rhamnusium bicolor]|uniref:Uncharacterized protein n=1 Tax=Rhamnusium bicolor TaxID=1586634 RepID=A0AAV8YM58_9CUCU|nr:hypothetical protein NQ314_007625 [Rhamnusium bicolor]